MKALRVLGFLLGFIAALGLLVGTAEARSSRRRSNGDRRGYRREGLISRRSTEERERERQKDRRKAQEETRERAQERKKELLERKKAQEAKRKERAQQLRKEQQAKQKGRTKRTRTAQRTGKSTGRAATKSDDAREKEAANLRQQAEAHFAKGELMPGVKLLRQMVEEYGGTQAAEGAEARLAQLIETEPFGQMILLEEGNEFFAAQRYRRAYNKYSALVERFPDSEQAAEARKRLEEIREGDLLSKSVYTPEELEDARFWLLVGNIRLENGRRQEAAAAYRTVIEEYPGCPYAQSAQEKLAAATKS